MKARRVDQNQRDIVRALRAIGCTVADTSRVGEGFPDLVVGYRGINHLIEIKDGKKVASKQKLTTPQKIFHALWRGKICVVKTVDEAIQIVTK